MTADINILCIFMLLMIFETSLLDVLMAKPRTREIPAWRPACALVLVSSIGRAEKALEFQDSKASELREADSPREQTPPRRINRILNHVVMQ
ncbi:hypothetical protein V8F06_003407 [Rhypophila decipiens]